MVAKGIEVLILCICLATIEWSQPVFWLPACSVLLL